MFCDVPNVEGNITLMGGSADDQIFSFDVMAALRAAHNLNSALFCMFRTLGGGVELQYANMVSLWLVDALWGRRVIAASQRSS